MGKKIIVKLHLNLSIVGGLLQIDVSFHPALHAFLTLFAAKNA